MSGREISPDRVAPSYGQYPVILLSAQFWPTWSMSSGVINSVKLCLSHPFSRIKWIDQWTVDPDPFLTSTTSAKIGKTAICAPVVWHRATELGGSRSPVETFGNCDVDIQCGYFVGRPTGFLRKPHPPLREVETTGFVI